MDPEILEILRGAVQLLDEGADPEQVDRAIKAETGLSGFDALATTAKAAGVSFDDIMAPLIMDRRGLLDGADEAGFLQQARESGIEDPQDAVFRHGALLGGLSVFPATRAARAAAPVARAVWNNPFGRKVIQGAGLGGGGVGAGKMMGDFLGLFDMLGGE